VSSSNIRPEKSPRSRTQIRKEIKFLPQIILYLVNVYEPCDERVLLDKLSSDSKPGSDGGGITIEALRRVIRQLLEANLIVESEGTTYFVTENGLDRLARVRAAFPRDKFRLYFLKDALKVRGQ
jgi:hypothetical protein